MKKTNFRQLVWAHYHQHGRDLPWRQTDPAGHYNAYNILVSEVMLQQTQVSRVSAKYQQFLAVFPSTVVLARAPLAEVLKTWQGLGYNRRALYLQQAAQRLPASSKSWSYEQLVDQTGIGPNTASAVVVYAFNQPRVFIETNIRSVYLHHFFANESGVADQQLLPLIEQTLDYQQPRQWYWALMDYGSWLKTTQPNPGRRSKHHSRQSAFEGSNRQLRGAVLRHLLQAPASLNQLQQHFKDERLSVVLAALSREQLISLQSGRYKIRK